jgi:hypothetical protein
MIEINLRGLPLMTEMHVPCWYWLLATVFSGWQAYRGYKLQWRAGIGRGMQAMQAKETAHAKETAQAKETATKETTKGNETTKETETVRMGGQEWPWWDRAVLLCFADGFTFLLCAFSGWLSLFVFWINLKNLGVHEHDLLLIFLFVYGLLGVTGKLPEILNKLKLPGMG